eukprot:Selendium_serpulae@DN4528_c0_g1_i2.p1
MSDTLRRKALVVGGTAGIGEGIALALAKRNMDVTIAGRSEERGAAVLKRLRKAATSATSEFAFKKVDAFDLKSVEELAKTSDDVNVLVLTQGMATTQGYTPTKDNIDQKLQLHYFSRFYLTRLMAPKMKYNDDPRVLTVLSGGLHGRYDKYDTDFDLSAKYTLKGAADAAGFYTDAGFEELAIDFPSVVMAHASPGFVASNWGTELSAPMRWATRAMQVMGRSIEKCGELLCSGLLALPNAKPKDDPDKKPGENFHIINQNGVVQNNAIKHCEEERQIIFYKTLEMLPELPAL